MNDSFSRARRRILRASVVGAAGFVAGSFPALKLRAAEVPQVTEDDPVAQSLKYVHDATQSERQDETQFCHNCIYFKGTESTPWAPCDIFPGKSVNTNGWCNVWTRKQ